MSTIIILAILGLIAFGIFSEEKFDFNSEDSAIRIRVKFKEALERHNKRILKIKDDGIKLRKERESFDDLLSFSKKLWEWIDEVKNYPHWFKNNKNDDGTPYWKSSAISPQKLTIKSFRLSALKHLSADCKDFKDNSAVLEYNFESDNNKYTLFIGKDGFTPDTWHSTDKVLSYHPAYIFENDSKLVYQAKLHDEYISDEIAGYHSWEKRELIAFKPSLWTGELLELFLAVKCEADKSQKAFWERLEQNRSKRDSKNFAD